MTDSTFRSLMAMANDSIGRAMESMSCALNTVNTEEDWCLETIRNGMVDAHIRLRMADDTVRTIRDETEKELERMQKEVKEAADDDV